MANTKLQQQPENVRLPLFGHPHQRDNSLKDQRYLNGFFEPVVNKLKNSVDYYFVKRPGLTSVLAPSITSTGRGAYFLNNITYSAVNDGSVDKLITQSGTVIAQMRSNLGIGRTFQFQETRPGVSPAYLAINTGNALYLVNPTTPLSTPVVALVNETITGITAASPAVVTVTSTAGLATGMKVNISGTNSTPVIDGLQTITVINSTTFSVAVDTSGGGGSTGNTGVFPANTGSLVEMDGYQFIIDSDCNIYNCNFDDPTTWDLTHKAIALMSHGTGIGLGRQNNYIVAFSNQHYQMFYDAGNTVGSPLTNQESAMNSVGCVYTESIAFAEDKVFWVSNTNIGDATVYMLQNTTGIKEVGVPQVNRIISSGSSGSAPVGFVSSAFQKSAFQIDTFQIGEIFYYQGKCVRIAGHLMYLLHYVVSGVDGSSTVDRTFMYDVENDMWCEWTGTSGLDGFDVCASVSGGPNNLSTTIIQKRSDGTIYTLEPTVTQDDGVNFPYVVTIGRYDHGTEVRKFVRRLSVIGDVQSSTANVSVQYTDDDYNTYSTARLYDMSQVHTFSTAFGNFRRRAWRLTYSGDQPMRIGGVELNLIEAED